MTRRQRLVIELACGAVTDHRANHGLGRSVSAAAHPIYTGLLTMYVGTALVTGEWLGVVGVAAALVAYWRKIRLEEANLTAAFANEYEAYRRETSARVPGVY